MQKYGQFPHTSLNKPQIKKVQLTDPPKCGNCGSKTGLQSSEEKNLYPKKSKKLSLQNPKILKIHPYLMK